jgi:hypothetical protein
LRGARFPIFADAVQPGRPQLQLTRPPHREPAREGGPIRAARVPGPPQHRKAWPEPQVFRTKLAALLEHLDRQLERPIEVQRDRLGRVVWVLGAIGYRICDEHRFVLPVARSRDGRLARLDYAVELYAPLSSPHALVPVIQALGLSGAGPQRSLFESTRHAADEEAWLARRAYWMLRADPRFRELRRRRLREAFALDPALVGIALAARRFPPASSLSNSLFNRVWRHEEAFRACARENPLLLSLVSAAFAEKKIEPCRDAVQALHRLFRSRGVSAAAWRFLCRHGTRFLRPAWRASQDRCVEATIGLLAELDRAGLPPPPSRWALRAWIWASLEHTTLGPDWNPVPPAVARSFLLEADRRRGLPALDGVRGEAELVLDWARDEQPRLDKRQRRAGWPWLVRQAGAWERRRALLDADGPREWPCADASVELDGLVATPIATLEALVDAGMALRNCLATQAHRCHTGRERFFSVREARSGRCIGAFCLRYREAVRAWTDSEAQGTANSPASKDIRRLAFAAARVYTASTGGNPHLGEGVDEISELLAGLE